MMGLYPVALAIKVKNDLTDVEAWGQAVCRERRLCGKQSCSSAAKIIMRAAAWAFSTSDVERLCFGFQYVKPKRGCRPREKV